MCFLSYMEAKKVNVDVKQLLEGGKGAGGLEGGWTMALHAHVTGKSHWFTMAYFVYYEDLEEAREKRQVDIKEVEHATLTGHMCSFMCFKASHGTLQICVLYANPQRCRPKLNILHGYLMELLVMAL